MQLVKIETNISNLCILMLYPVADTGTHISNGISKVILFLFRKSIYKGTHNFIHFNLSMSLMIGLIIFISGVETARDIKVMLLLYHKSRQNVSLSRLVAILLHYFFLAAFVWMLCEGIFVFIYFNYIFYTGFFAKKYF